MVFSSSSSTYEDTPGTSDGSEFQSNPEHTHSFRVVIAGAGVGGLVISHALTRAGIEHVVLEKGVVAPNWGASISIWAKRRPYTASTWMLGRHTSCQFTVEDDIHT